MKLNSATYSNAALAEGANSRLEPGAGVRLALIVLRGYKLIISPLFTGACRFTPSCSDYAAGAIRQHGIGRGSWLAVKRLARCHPFCAGGHDPVPPRI